ncbi:MAG: NADP-dependent glyceraldehyde-3-phosphate dehydrogenase [Candidatus Omnitrophica bacterium]|nr:NADP-dependent glyceraldehyde-3-phosphate dehydrogenase [Candidatus Omnitrophota bacterium]
MNENLSKNKGDIPKEFMVDIPVIQKEYLINGEILEWEGDLQEVYSPICENKGGSQVQIMLGKYPLLTETEALQALDAATNAYKNGRGKWPTMSIAERIGHVEIFIEKIIVKREEVINLLMWEIGKSYADSIKEFDRTVDYIKDTIKALKELDINSSKFVTIQGVIGQIKRSPLGVVLCMGPFNYPLNETFTTLIPALIMGNAVIFKPPKYGVLLHRPLLEAFRSSFPQGVINAVYGEGQKIIGPLMASGKINSLAFIGSSKVANILQKQHPKPHRCRFVLGLEAKNASIILPDADIDLTVKEHLLGTLSYNGQRCTAIKIIFVHKSVRDRFIDDFCNKVDNLKCGMPWDKDVQITPLPETGKVGYMKELLTDADNKGGKVVNKKSGEGGGTLFFPAVVFPVNSEMRLYNEEQFGPIVPIVEFEDIEEPIQYVINSNYGQQISIFGKDSDTIAKLIDPLVNQVCRVNINSQCQRGPDEFPFTGRKDSAEGTLSVSDALKVFSIRTLVATKDVGLNKNIMKEIVSGKKSNFLTGDNL